jgi:hypothetical protein
MYTMPEFHIRRKDHVDLHLLVVVNMLPFSKDPCYTNALMEGIYRYHHDFV